jgi:flagellar basal body rod protein FlgG
MNDAIIHQGRALLAAQQALDRTANNMANIGTVGFKRDQPWQSFEQTLANATPPVDWSEGKSMETGEPLDLAVSGPGLFVVNTPNGERYTRDGRMKLSLSNGEARLVSTGGFEVQGESGPIVADPSGGAVTVGRDGTVRQGTSTLGKLRLAWPEHLQDLTKEGGGLFASQSTPAAVAQPVIRQGYLESSNAEGPVEMVGMINVMRTFETNARSVKTQDGSWQRLIQALNGRI